MDHTASKFDEFDNISGKGYEQDGSRMEEDQSISSRENSKKQTKQTMMPIARKRKVSKESEGEQVAYKRRNHLTDSGYEQDVPIDMAVLGDDSGKLDREEETQVLPYSLGKYIDHSLDPDDDHPFAPIHKKPNFPESLFAMLSNSELSSIIQWLPHGRSFTILNRDQLAKRVLPLYYRHSNNSSFNRQLNGYGFKKLKIGPTEKSYYHPFFLRNLPHLVTHVTRSSKGSLSDDQSIDESLLSRVSTERPLPEKMSPLRAKQVKKVNQDTFEVHAMQCEAPAPDSNEADLGPVPSFIYTPSPCPLPQDIYTPLQQHPQFQPQLQSQSQLPNSSGTIFTQTHLPLTGSTPSPALQSVHLPFQTQQPFQLQLSSQPSGYTQQSAPATQFNQIQTEEIRQAQIQLFANAIAAAVGQQRQNFQPLDLQLGVNPTFNTSPTTHLGPSPQSNGLEPLFDTIGIPNQMSSSLQQQSCDSVVCGQDSGTYWHGVQLNGLMQQQQQQMQHPYFSNQHGPTSQDGGNDWVNKTDAAGKSTCDMQ